MVAPESQARDPVEMLAEEFLERRRRGEVPSLREYTDRYPHLADEIRDVFPALVVMDEIDPRSAELKQSMGGVLGRREQGELRQLGEYRILREVGQGGMGIVYEARQESLGRRVALKVLPPITSGRERFRERFQREARAAARLHHTNIVPVFGVGEDRGILYYAMQFIQGQGLDAVLRDVKQLRGLAPDLHVAEQPTLSPNCSEAARWLMTGEFQARPPGTDLPIAVQATSEPLKSSEIGTRSELSQQPEARYYRSIAQLGVQAAEALAHAHAQGILHRDIKPSNLLLDAQGTLWITDFGLAKTEESEDLTNSGELIGTLRYMPPERFEGKGDARGDIYALGVTLYEMLTLTPPFKGGDRVSLMAQIASDTLVPPSQRAPHLPRDLETIVLKAMAREPAARYTTPRDLADDLRRFLENRPIKARRSSTAENLRRWCRRNPAVASLMVTVSILLLCLTVGSMLTAIRLKQKEEDRTEKLYEALTAQASASRFSHRVGQRFGTLEAVRNAVQLVRERNMPLEQLDGLRTLAIAALTLPDFHTLQSWAGLTDIWQHWAADNQLHWYARAEEQGEITLRLVGSGEEVTRMPGLGHSPDLQFSPGGRFLAAYGANRLRAWDVTQEPPRIVYEGEEHGFAFHPDGRHVLLRRSDGSLWLHDWEAAPDKPVRLAALLPSPFSFVFDPTGKRLAVIHDGKAELLDAETGSVTLSLDEKQPDSPAWHPSGNYLALVCPGHEIHVWDLKRNRRLSTLKVWRNDGMRVAFTPDGERLLSQGYEAALRMWDWRTGGELLRLPGGCDLKVSADGRFLLRNDKQLSLVEMATGRERRSLVKLSDADRETDYFRPRISPNGRLLAVPMSDATRLFDLRMGDELAELPLGGYVVTFAQDGSLLTNGLQGLLRWPIRTATSAGRLKVGPPVFLHYGTFLDIATDQTGDVIGQAAGMGAFLLRPGKPILRLGPHVDARHISISPDGKYAATGNHGGDEGAKIWDTTTGELVARVETGGGSGGIFTADSKRFYAQGTRDCKMLKVGTWEEFPAGAWDGFLTFSPDGGLVLTGAGSGVICLQTSDTGHEIARIEDPESDYGDPIFTPDGRALVAKDDSRYGIQVWDLAAIRRQLAELGLDWDQPALAEAPEQTALEPLVLDVDYGEFPHNSPAQDRQQTALSSILLAANPFNFMAYFDRGKAFGHVRDYRNAVADFSMALLLMPRDYPLRGEALLRRADLYRYQLHDTVRADADLVELAENDLRLPKRFHHAAAHQLNSVAWTYLTAPERDRAPGRALLLARLARKFAPEDWMTLNTLGVAYYRLGNHALAQQALQGSLRESHGEAAAFDLFFLAMCHARQGALHEARRCYDQAVGWVQQNPKMLDAQPHWRDELIAFQAEAKAVLAGKPSTR
jgi:serine/threonine protein kinase/WD40 repeat protein